MTDESKPKVPILEVAWKLYAQLDAISMKQFKPHYRWFGWISALGVFAVLLAVITHTYADYFHPMVNLGLKISLIVTLIAVSVLAVFVNKFSHEIDWRVSRAGAEMMQKEIYMYRTYHKDNPDRREWLEGRLDDIQNQVRRGLSGELVLDQPPAEIPPNLDPGNPNNDEGFEDLTGDEYIRYRLENQLAKHIRKIQKFEGQRTRQQIYILLVGGAGVLLAAIGGSYSIWAALTTSLMVVLIGWQGMRNLDKVVKNHSRVVMELMAIYDHWNMLEPDERTNDEFFHMVKLTEDVLLSQNIEYIRYVQDALAKETPETPDLIESPFQEVDQDAEAIRDKKPDTEVEINSQALVDVLPEVNQEEAQLNEAILRDLEEIESAFKDKKSDSEVVIASPTKEDLLTEEPPKKTELDEGLLEETDEVEELVKDIKSDSEVEITSQVIEDVLPEKQEEAELDESIIQDVEEIESAFKDIKPESEVVIASQVIEDVREISEEGLIEELGSLAEEAASELVQAELAAIAEAASQAGLYALSADQEGAGRLSDTLDAIAKEFEDVEIGRDTPAKMLNDLMSRYPKTKDVNG